ncbi:hypothetical protein L208DRAFT_1415011 [Tricholoma matsutake]|nr:hypothetical protein L208DRAFT_1415011 [Tricholoma matsutake 945]
MGAYLSNQELHPTPTDPASFHHPLERDVYEHDRLSLELADMILDLAKYWRRIVTHEKRHFEVQRF